VNYTALRRTIWIAWTLALLLSGAVLVVVLRMTRGGQQPPDFAGAGALAIVIPTFAGALLASLSVYAYVKSEDPVLKESEQMVLSTQKLRSLFDSWISTLGLGWQTKDLRALKPVLESTSETAIGLLYNSHILVVLSASFQTATEKQAVYHAASRLVLSLRQVCDSQPGTDASQLRLPSGENTLGVLLQAMDKLLGDMSGLPPAEGIRSLVAQSYASVLRAVLHEIMQNAQVARWS
jgi:hypothetical protein